MKVWTKVHIKDKNKQVELISKAFTNYLYTYGPILNIFRKYGVSLEDKKALDKYVSNMEIYGETKRIPVNETQYIHFTINLNTEEKVELKNVLTYIDIYSKDYNTDDIAKTANVKLQNLDYSLQASVKLPKSWAVRKSSDSLLTPIFLTILSKK